MKSAILRVVLALALCAATGDYLYAGTPTGEIHGRVTARETGKPIAYANVIIVGTNMGAMTLADGFFKIVGVPPGKYTVRALTMGFANVDHKDVVVKPGKKTELAFVMKKTIVVQTQAIEVRGERPMLNGNGPRFDEMQVRGGRGATHQAFLVCRPAPPCTPPYQAWRYRPPVDREQYDHLGENDYLDAVGNPLSTFSIDVDAASYANARRFIRQGALPPPDAVRVEEFINYFDYDYPDPTGDDPFAIVTEVSGCPWNTKHRLVHIGIQGRRIDARDLPPSNLVFLIDVSGSMQPPNKLPLIKAALPMLVAQLRRSDRVAIVVYAGSAGLVLDSTPGSAKRDILDAIERLQSGGSTAGGAGIQLAYKVARDHFIKGGNNRVILATDGDFNVGVTDDGSLVRLIEEERKSGVFLTVLGVGEGNLQDARMEKLADHGNGNYAYLDDLLEAQKVLVSEMSGTLVTIAKDVKIQVEFNPARVQSYRLIGYENRMLKKEDFADDKKDAGELGAGHSVTALYEILPAGEGEARGDDLKYTSVTVKPDAREHPEILTVRLRYKAPDGDTSKLVERTAEDHGTTFKHSSETFRFAAAVAEFGMLLRDSKYAGRANFDQVIEAGRTALGSDREGYRAELVELAKTCKGLKPVVAKGE